VALELESFGDAGGEVYNNRYCFVMTVREGLVTRINEYVDTKHAGDVLVPFAKQMASAKGQRLAFDPKDG